MADLLLELFSEEIPARMQAQAAKDLERIVVGALSDRGLLFEGAKAFAGPRRLTLLVAGLPAKQPDVSEELKGPKVDAPAAAVDGFLKKTGLTREQLTVQEAPKGKVYLAVIKRDGRPTADVLGEILPECFAKLPWPKSMRWPQKTNAPVRWVRPLHSILCTLDGEVVPFVFAGVASGNTTRGHRFLSMGVIEARRFEDYEKKLHDAHVILDAEQRKAIIFEGVKGAAFVHGLELIADEGLLDEVAGLAEWPVVLLGTIEDQFMDVPPEILQTAMRVHQKYFALRDPKTGKMANRFALVANMIAEDAGKQIVAGNERVLRARLSDAKFFWDQDRKRTLESRVDDLKNIVFHARLGTQLERVHRIRALAGKIAPFVGASPQLAKEAAWLAKADLTTGVVGEFPELQGVMGGYYAQHDNLHGSVSNAIRDHYKPNGPRDAMSSEPVTMTVALADKLDMLSSFFSIGEKPTGSGDPFALRRAALGAIRIILSYNIRLPLSSVISLDTGIPEFLVDRLKVLLRETHTRHDLIDAVFSVSTLDDIKPLVDRTVSLQAFLGTDDGANLLAGYKRAANILKAEEKKDGQVYAGEVLESHLTEASEVALFAALTRAREAIAPALEREDFAGAMTVMAGLRAPVDAFFGAVKVNADDKVVRANRLNLLGALRATLNRIADFSKIEG